VIGLPRTWALIFRYQSKNRLETGANKLLEITTNRTAGAIIKSREVTAAEKLTEQL